MITLQLADPRTILCVGAHCDDIEIGCAGALAGWAERFPEVRFIWWIFSGCCIMSQSVQAEEPA